MIYYQLFAYTVVTLGSEVSYKIILEEKEKKKKQIGRQLVCGENIDNSNV